MAPEHCESPMKKYEGNKKEESTSDCKL